MASCRVRLRHRVFTDPQHEHDACGVGFVVDIKGRKSHAIVRQALQVLKNLQHRGACGCEVNTGDGAGILVQMPDTFLRKVAPVALPPRRARTASAWSSCRRSAERPRRHRASCSRGSSPRKASGSSAGATCRPTIGPVGPSAVAVEPVFDRCSSGASGELDDVSGAEPSASALRAQAVRHPQAHRARGRRLGIAASAAKAFYIVSLSCNTLIYKGMLTADQIEPMFPDLTDPDLESALALVHQRFSTNTFPSWPLAHPYRYIAHNGEINTLTRQHQLDARPRRAAAVGRCSATT